MTNIGIHLEGNLNGPLGIYGPSDVSGTCDPGADGPWPGPEPTGFWVVKNFGNFLLSSSYNGLDVSSIQNYNGVRIAPAQVRGLSSTVNLNNESCFYHNFQNISKPEENNLSLLLQNQTTKYENYFLLQKCSFIFKIKKTIQRSFGENLTGMIYIRPKISSELDDSESVIEYSYEHDLHFDTWEEEEEFFNNYMNEPLNANLRVDWFTTLDEFSKLQYVTGDFRDNISIIVNDLGDYYEIEMIYNFDNIWILDWEKITMGFSYSYNPYGVSSFETSSWNSSWSEEPDIIKIKKIQAKIEDIPQDSELLP